MTQTAYAVVETDCGLAEVFHQGPRAKVYKCPLCEYNIEGEWHVVIKPKSNSELRRHVHKGCLDKYIEYGLEIKLLPGRKNWKF